MADGANFSRTVQGFDLGFIVSFDKKGPLDLGYGDIVYMRDDVDTQAIFNRELEDDNVTVTDAFAKSLVIAKSFADAVEMSDALAITWERSLTVADAVEMTDLFVRSGTYGRTFDDMVMVSDAVMVGMAGMANLPLHDTAAIVDAGVASKYDYAGPDYFVAPGDYVGEQRFF
jgi:hypothetical protein